ncbi:recombinase family protein [Gluconobacter sp. Gdi]|uniref:recombinase family protein n=1 Tax=Gluconobacter sp. Gdi TaxID=2691888 RepID=UPI0027E40F4C|nr:recombinase family protein [Gluconobacter sp. Gdi]
MVIELRNEGLSLRQIASRLAHQGIRTAKGGMWTAAAVRRVSVPEVECVKFSQESA